MRKKIDENEAERNHIIAAIEMDFRIERDLTISEERASRLTELLEEADKMVRLADRTEVHGS